MTRTTATLKTLRTITTRTAVTMTPRQARRLVEGLQLRRREARRAWRQSKAGIAAQYRQNEQRHLRRCAERGAWTCTCGICQEAACEVIARMARGLLPLRPAMPRPWPQVAR